MTSNKYKEVIEFVKSNTKYLQLIEEENGEYTLETRLFNKSERLLLNKDAMIQVGDQIIKAFENGTIKAPVELANVVKGISEKDFLANSIKDSRITRNIKLNSKDLLAKEYHDRKTDGKDRLYMGVECSDPTLMGLLDYKVEYTVRPYKKTLGIWYYCTRTIEGEMFMTVSYDKALYPDKIYLEYYDYIPRAGRSVASRTWKVDSHNVDKWYGFGRISCWASSASVNEMCRIDY